MIPVIRTDENYVIKVKIPRLTIKKRKKFLFKTLALVLIVLGVIACYLFPEDATGGFMCCLLGIAVLFGNVDEM